jgi:hypothetical protein
MTLKLLLQLKFYCPTVAGNITITVCFNVEWGRQYGSRDSVVGIATGYGLEN